MRKRYNRNVFMNVVWHFLQKPEYVVELFYLLVLAWTLLQVFIGYAGYLPFGGNLIGFSGWLVLATFLHAVLVFIRRESVHFYWEALLPLPFIGYLFVHYLVLAPFPWSAAPVIMTMLQAYALFLLVLYVSRRGRSRMRMLLTIFGVFFLLVVAAFLQFYAFPQWSPYEGRLRSDLYGYGAGGFIAEPENLAALVLLFLPLAILVTWLPRFAGPVRILSGLIAFFGIVAYLMGTHLMGLIVLLLLLLALPFFLTNVPAMRRRYYLFGSIGVILALPLFWFGTDALQARMEYFWNYPEDTIGIASRQIGYAIFLQHPLLGAGLGSFADLWQTYVPEGIVGSSVYPISIYSDLLAELGLLGALLALAPIAWLLAGAYREWRGMVMFKVDKDIESRLRGLSARRRERLRKQLRRGKVPAPKLVLGGLLLGYVSFALYGILDYSLKLAGVLFLFAMLMGMLVLFTHQGDKQAFRSRLTLFAAFAPLGLSLFAYGFGAVRMQAQNIVYEARERLELVSLDENRVFADPAVVYEIEEMLGIAVELDPGNGSAWALLGEAHLARLHMDLHPPADVGELALGPLRKAVQLAPLNWEAQYNYARALALSGSAPAEILQPLRMAVAAAPQRAEPKALLGALYLLGHGVAEEAMAMIDRASVLQPDYPPLVALLSRLAMSGGNLRQGGVLNEAILAAQFPLVLSKPRRIEAAGRLDPAHSGGILPRVLE